MLRLAWAARAVRAALETLSRDRVIRRRMPPELGGHTLRVSPDSAMTFWRRDLRQADPVLLRMARELVRPGAIVWDIGANVGLFAVAAAFLAGPTGRVVAIEADAWLAGLLRESARTLPADHAPIEVLIAAAGGAEGVADFSIASRGRAANHLASMRGSTQAGGTRDVQKVAMVTLDWLLAWFPPPQLIKLDVEGAELECLRGAEEILARHRPTLLCEVSGQNAAAIGQLLGAAGYDLYDSQQPAGARRRLPMPVWNTLAVPCAGDAAAGDAR